MTRDPDTLWALPDAAFFTSGACHVLAHAFVARYPGPGFRAALIRPLRHTRGFHVFVHDGVHAFDATGFSHLRDLVDRHGSRHREMFPGWEGEVIPVSASPIDPEFCREHHHRTLDRFPGDVLARASRFLANAVVFPGARGSSAG